MQIFLNQCAETGKTIFERLMSPFKTQGTFEWNDEEGITRRYPAEILAWDL